MRKIEIKNFCYNCYAIPTIGDGSCFIHSILQACFRNYERLNTNDRKKLSKFLRKELSCVLSEEDNGENYYNKLGRGEIKMIGEVVPEYSLPGMKKKLDSNSWIDISCLEHISDQLDLDIIIIDERRGDVYQTGDKETYFKDRDTIIINYIDEVHFETIAISTPELVTFFDKDSEIIRELKRRYK